MRYIKEFSQFEGQSVLIVIDVQKSFNKFFNKKYIEELKKYCKKFDMVYQIYDNHVEGKNPDKDYLYKENPPSPVTGDLYKFSNQVDIIEKRYRYDVDIDFFKSELTSSQLKEIAEREKNDDIKVGEYFHTKKGTILVFINNNHNWFECPVKLYNLLLEMKGKEVIMVGGADRECFTDVEITAKSLGVKVKRNDKFIYSAMGCQFEY